MRNRRCVLVALCLMLLWVGAPAQAELMGMAEVQAKAAVVMDAYSGSVVYEQNADAPLPIASVTKVMTLLLGFEALEEGKISLEDQHVASANAAGMGGSQVFIGEGLSYTVSDLFKSIIVASGNDACVAMAELLYGSEESCVAAMNQRATALGMANTVFKNCTGLPAEGAVSTARDVACMARALLQHPVFFQYSTIWLDELVHEDGRTTVLTNTNKPIRSIQGYDGLKTGYTDAAGHCVASTAIREDTRLIAVVLGAPDSKTRFGEVEKLLNAGFAQYASVVAVTQGEALTEALPVKRTCEAVTQGIASETLRLFVPKEAEVTREVELDEAALQAPLTLASVLGKVNVYVDGKLAAQCDLVPSYAVAKATFWDRLRWLCRAWWHEEQKESLTA